MIDIKTGKIMFDNKEEDIKEWVVWFRSPFGLYKDRESAVKHIEKVHMDSHTVIVPVPVAISDTLHEVAG